MGNAFNAFFLIWTALFSIGLFGLYLTLIQIKFSALPANLTSNFPRKTIAIYLIVIGLVLLTQYLLEVFTSYTSAKPPFYLDHYTTLELASLELGIMIPLKFVSGVALWRRKNWGYIAAAVLIFTTFIVFIALSVSLLLFFFNSGSGNLIDMAITFFITIIAAGFWFVILKSKNNMKYLRNELFYTALK